MRQWVFNQWEVVKQGVAFPLSCRGLHVAGNKFIAQYEESPEGKCCLSLICNRVRGTVALLMLLDFKSHQPSPNGQGSGMIDLVIQQHLEAHRHPSPDLRRNKD